MFPKFIVFEMTLILNNTPRIIACILSFLIDVLLICRNIQAMCNMHMTITTK